MRPLFPPGYQADPSESSLTAQLLSPATGSAGNTAGGAQASPTFSTIIHSTGRPIIQLPADGGNPPTTPPSSGGGQPPPTQTNDTPPADNSGNNNPQTTTTVKKKNLNPVLASVIFSAFVLALGALLGLLLVAGIAAENSAEHPELNSKKLYALSALSFSLLAFAGLMKPAEIGPPKDKTGKTKKESKSATPGKEVVDDEQAKHVGTLKVLGQPKLLKVVISQGKLLVIRGMEVISTKADWDMMRVDIQDLQVEGAFFDMTVGFRYRLAADPQKALYDVGFSDAKDNVRLATEMSIRTACGAMTLTEFLEAAKGDKALIKNCVKIAALDAAERNGLEVELEDAKYSPPKSLILVDDAKPSDPAMREVVQRKALNRQAAEAAKDLKVPFKQFRDEIFEELTKPIAEGGKYEMPKKLAFQQANEDAQILVLKLNAEIIKTGNSRGKGGGILVEANIGK